MRSGLYVPRDQAALAAHAVAEAAAPWLSSWLAPHVAGAYVQVAPASEPLKPPDALLAFDMAVVRAPGRPEAVGTARASARGTGAPTRRSRRSRPTAR